MKCEGMIRTLFFGSEQKNIRITIVIAWPSLTYLCMWWSYLPLCSNYNSLTAKMWIQSSIIPTAGRPGGSETQDLSWLKKSLPQFFFFSPSFHLVWFETVFQASITNVPSRLPLLMLQHYEFLLCAFLSTPKGLHWNLIGSVGWQRWGSLYLCFFY